MWEGRGEFLVCGRILLHRGGEEIGSLRGREDRFRFWRWDRRDGGKIGDDWYVRL